MYICNNVCVQVGKINGHINPSSVGQFVFHGAILKQALIIAIQASLIALTVSKEEKKF